jgi:hypothetical protein
LTFAKRPIMTSIITLLLIATKIISIFKLNTINKNL